MKLKIRYKIYLLKKYFNKCQNYYNLYLKQKKQKAKFVGFFIKDEEDKELNKKVLNEFDSKIQKYHYKRVKFQNKIDKILYNLDIIDLNYIEIIYNLKFSYEDCELIKNILKNKLR